MKEVIRERTTTGQIILYAVSVCLVPRKGPTDEVLCMLLY